MATAKKAPAQKQTARPAASAKSPAAKKSAAAPAKSSTKPAKSKAAPATSSKSAPVKPAASKPALSKPAPAMASPKSAAIKAAPAKAPARSAPATAPATKAAAPATQTATAPPVAKKVPSPAPTAPRLPASVKGEKDGVKFTKDFDAKFLLAQRTLLLEERVALSGQATRLEDEANALIEEQEMGDVQFDDEGGEGDTMVVERERDLALSAQARQTIADIDAALERLTQGTYGYSLESGRPISRERLEAIPWATVLVEEKVGGIGRR